MKIQPFQALYPNLAVLADPDTFFATVKYEFAEYLKDNFFLETEESGLYLCEIHSPDRVHIGLVTSVDIEDYIEGHILQHEKTITATEAHLTELLMQRKAMIKPVLLAYPGHPVINELIAEARKSEVLFSIFFEKEQQKQVYYKISEPDLLSRFQEAWKECLPKAYIADGHHRCSSSAHLYKSLEKGGAAAEHYRYLLCAFFAFDQLVIREYNRVVELPREMSPTIFLAALSRICNIKYIHGPANPGARHEMTLYINREWYRLRWKKKVLSQYAGELVTVDTDLLNKEVLHNILGIEDVSNDTRISYADGISGLEGLADKTDKSPFRVGFCMYPLTIGDLVTIADAGKTLPPKSTWFEPRTKNGLISLRI